MDTQFSQTGVSQEVFTSTILAVLFVADAKLIAVIVVFVFAIQLGSRF